jgi:RNA polymerase sigma-70 factor, ECF subfamily
MAPLLAQRPRVDRAFERLYRRHVSDVYHYALAVLRNPADAEDVTQTAFLNAYSAYRRGERPAAPRNWLIAIAHNVCRQRFRQSARRPHEVALDEDVADTLVADDAPSAQDIRTALGYLAFNQRAALVMRELEGRSYAEIAELLELSVSAVETLIFRARRALREQLEGSLTCQQAERALSRQLDGRLARSERGALRAHLRACPECASFARSQRAHRAALRSIAAIPLPSSLASFFGGGAAAGTGLAVKAAAVVAVGAVVTGVGYEGAKRLPLSTGNAGAVERQANAGDGSEQAGAAAVAAVAGSIGRRSGSAVRDVGTSRGGNERTAREAAAPAGKGVAKNGRTTARSDAKLAKARTHGRPTTSPGQVRSRTTAARGHSTTKPHRTRPTAPPGRTKAKPARPKTADSGSATQPAKPKPEPPGQAKQPVAAVPQPDLPPPPALPQPELPDSGKVKK